MQLPWGELDCVLLDMDGTLLDLNFDNHFWQEHIPLRYAEARDLSLDQAHAEMQERYRGAAATLAWYSVEFWQAELDLDIMRLKEEVAHLIAVHPHVTDFLSALRVAGKHIVLVTNAHQKSLALKMQRTGLTVHFDALISAHELGLPKEDPAFWDLLRGRIPFDPARTLLVDDNMSVLDSARAGGIAQLVAVTRPDTKRPQTASAAYPGIVDFGELLPGLSRTE